MVKHDDGKVKATVYFSTRTYEELDAWILARYGRNVRALSITVEQALQEFLERHPLEASNVPA